MIYFPGFRLNEVVNTTSGFLCCDLLLSARLGLSSRMFFLRLFMQSTNFKRMCALFFEHTLKEMCCFAKSPVKMGLNNAWRVSRGSGKECRSRLITAEQFVMSTGLVAHFFGSPLLLIIIKLMLLEMFRCKKLVASTPNDLKGVSTLYLVFMLNISSDMAFILYYLLAHAALLPYPGKKLF